MENQEMVMEKSWKKYFVKSVGTLGGALRDKMSLCEHRVQWSCSPGKGRLKKQNHIQGRI